MTKPAPSSSAFTSRLQKGGALLSDMRLMVSRWSDEMSEAGMTPDIARMLTKSTRARAKDTYIRAFRPRFIAGNPPEAWRLARTLEDHAAPPEVTTPFYYWLTARAEPPLYEFASAALYAKSRSHDREVRIEETVAWLDKRVQKDGKEWTPTVCKKVARGILATLRDFGILEGAVRKRVAPVHLAPQTFALIAFVLHELGTEGKALVAHPDWRIFLLGETGADHLFMECHQHRWLRYDSAGNIRRIEFLADSFKEYVDVVLG